MYSDVVTLNGQALAVTDAFFAPSQAWYTRAAVKNGVTCAIAQGPDCTLVKDSTGRRLTFAEPSFGVNCVGIDTHVEGWLLIWMLGPLGATYKQVVLSDDFTVLSAFYLNTPPWPESPRGETGQGLIDISDTGTLIMKDAHPSVTLGGHVISHPAICGRFTFGESNDFFGVGVWDTGTKTYYKAWEGQSQLLPHMTLLDDGTPVVCPGGTDLLIPFSQWTAWTAPPVMVTVPEFTPAPINCLPFDPPTGVEGLSDVYVWGSFHADTNHNDPIQPILDAAEATGKPELAYYDDQPFNVKGVPAFPNVAPNCYPKNEWTLEQSLTAARVAVNDCKAHKRRATLVPAVYLGNGAVRWDEQHTIDLALGLWNLAIELDCDVAPYGNIHASCTPALHDVFTRMIAAAKGRPVTPQPKPQPPSLELLMPALTLKKSGFKKGSVFPERFIYPLSNGKNMSIDSETGEQRPGGMAANEASESFLYTPGSGRTEVDFGTHLYTYLVDETR